MTLVRPPGVHPEREYGTLDYKGAVVLDIGADYGSTAEFFLGRGAKRVVAVERNRAWLARLNDWASGKPVDVVNGLTRDNVGKLFREHLPDVVKVDCEGCECVLLTLNDDLLSAPKSWVMETHSRPLFESFTATFRRLGYTVKVVEEFPANPPERHRKVFTAVRP